MDQVQAEMDQDLELWMRRTHGPEKGEIPLPEHGDMLGAARYIRDVARIYDPKLRLLANARAEDIADAMEAAISVWEQRAPEAWTWEAIDGSQYERLLELPEPMDWTAKDGNILSVVKQLLKSATLWVDEAELICEMTAINLRSLATTALLDPAVAARLQAEPALLVPRPS